LRTTAEAAQENHEVLEVIGFEPVVGGHGGAGDAVADDGMERVVGAFANEAGCHEVRAASASAGEAVAEGAVGSKDGSALFEVGVRLREGRSRGEGEEEYISHHVEKVIETQQGDLIRLLPSATLRRKRADFGGGQLAVLADGKVADSDRADGGAHQLEHLRSERFDHAADLAVAAFGDGDFEEGPAFRVAEAGDGGGLGGTIAQRQATMELIELLIREARG
jgi:hypothetical protein